MSFWGELKRRSVFKVGAAYAIVAWLIVQVATAVLPSFEAPRWAIQTIVFLLILGFPVALLAAWAFDVTPGGIRRTENVSRRQSITPVTGQRLNYVIVASLILAVAFLLAGRYILDEDPDNEEPRTAAALAEQAPNAGASAGDRGHRDVLPNSVAVLPCENFSTDPENAFFAASLHEELLDQLFKLRNLNVIARTSVLQYARAARPITEIASELGVESIMECSVAYGDGRIVISAQLIDGAMGLHLWSERYNREFDDVFGIQSDIATNVANALKAEFSDVEQQAIERRPTKSSAAYALYLEARNQQRVPRGLQRAQALLNSAITIDPEFARAYGLKANFYADDFTNSVGSDAVAAEARAELESRIRANAERALALDPSDPDARDALRSLNVATWRWRAYAQALEPDDEVDLATQTLWVLCWMGQQERAVRIAQRRLELDPKDPNDIGSLSIVQAYAGDRDAAMRNVRKVVESLPAAPLVQAWRAYNAIALDETSEALEALQLVEQLLGETRPTVFLPELAYSYARIGRADDARRLFDEIQARAAENDVGAGTQVLAYLAIGDEARALEWLGTAVGKARLHEPDQGLLALMNLKMNFLADPRIEQPPLADALARVHGNYE